MSVWDNQSKRDYLQFAALYDRLMEDIPYQRWLEFARNQWQKRWGVAGERPPTVVDLACGTGTLTAMLASQGYHMIGIDLSENMLAVAEEKTRGLSVHLSHQDMRDFSLPYPVDTVLCFVDSLNYLLNEIDVQQTFHTIYQQLNEDGIFLFDVHTPHKIREIFGNHTFYLVDDEVSYIWQCSTDPVQLTVEHDLTFFVRESDCDLYQKFDECHQQRAYPLHQLEEWLKRAGFQQIEFSAEFGEETPGPEHERVFVAAFK